MSDIPPSPQAPWQRPVQSPAVQTITGDDAIDLVKDTTYLVQETPKVGADFYSVTLPDGNHRRQFKRIYIPAENIPNTAEFKLTGTFAGFDFLMFNNAAFSAVLEWDGSGWQFIGGNASQQ